ncbi:hypothetical protein K701_29510 [Streptomyces fradiae ATCC 10745 = DSM 40063]|uniref:Uncharacterized protein n=1 Tax=Streptomyces fradiae ATCC 10745 = DSM 40063 TaxID=1319510 RepID=A0ABQ6XKI7_STRFR|nr:hypothetical protein K701_29510 [Streptomyces fradiae ATCC 10745 = DSM 40063]
MALTLPSARISSTISATSAAVKAIESTLKVVYQEPPRLVTSSPSSSMTSLAARWILNFTTKAPFTNARMALDRDFSPSS